MDLNLGSGCEKCLVAKFVEEWVAVGSGFGKNSPILGISRSLVDFDSRHPQIGGHSPSEGRIGDSLCTRLCSQLHKFPPNPEMA